MGTFDTLFRELASTLIDLFADRQITIVQTIITYDPETGVETPVSTSYVVNASPRIDYKESEIDGFAIKKGDFYQIIPAAEIVIVPDPQNCHVEEGGEERQLVNVIHYESGDLAAAYQLQQRK